MQYPLELDAPTISLYEEEPLTPPAKQTKERIDWKAIFAGAVFVGGLLWAAHNEIEKINERLEGIDKHISRVETAVRIVGAKQGGDTKTLIDEALTVAKNAADAGHTEQARSVIEITNRLLSEEKTAKVERPQAFFDQTFKQYQQLRLRPALQSVSREATLTLAEYRTAIAQGPPDIPTTAEFYVGSMRQLPNGFVFIKDAYLRGNAMATGAGVNSIDYTILDNVTFEDAEITYRGGPVVLKNVRFINCRFHFPDSPQGDLLLAATIQQPSNAKIGQVPNSPS